MREREERERKKEKNSFFFSRELFLTTKKQENLFARYTVSS